MSKDIRTIRKSPWVSLFNVGGCTGCAIECIALFTPKYDIERFGCLMKYSPRNADILLVTGPINRQTAARLKMVYSQMSKAKKAIAIGQCACSGGPWRTSYNIKEKTVDSVIPIELYLPGCPPRPEAIINALLKVLTRFKQPKSRIPKKSKKR